MPGGQVACQRWRLTATAEERRESHANAPPMNAVGDGAGVGVSVGVGGGVAVAAGVAVTCGVAVGLGVGVGVGLPLI